MTDPPSRTASRRFFASISLVLCTLAVAAAPDGPAEIFRIGFSQTMFVGVNENDAKATIKGMATEFSRQRQIPSELDAHVLEGIDAVAEAVRRQQVNYVGLTTEEYAALRDQVGFDRFTAAINDGSPTERYAVYAHRGRQIRSLGDLRAGHLARPPGPRMSLGPLWLDVTLAKMGVPETAKFFGRQTEFAKPGKAILAVFFQQADACLVLKRTFDTMAELNPQLARDLEMVAISPEYVPTIFAFSADFPTKLKEHSLREFSEMHLTAAGQQILTIFQTAQTGEIRASDLESALALIEEHGRLCPDAAAARRSALRHPKKEEKL